MYYFVKLNNDLIQSGVSTHGSWKYRPRKNALRQVPTCQSPTLRDEAVIKDGAEDEDGHDTLP